MEELQFRLEVFEGPLDLLLTLISKNKVDIRDIPIVLILDQYMEYLDRMRTLDAEISGEFIVMAAELMLIKSKMLLPKPEKPEQDPRAGLANALLAYKEAKENAEVLKERHSFYGGRFVKDAEVIDTSCDAPTGLDPAILQKALMKALARGRDLPRLARASENAIRDLLQAKVVPVAERVWFLMRTLYREGTLSMESVLLRSENRSCLIATFLALLELLRAGRIVAQEVPDTEGECEVLLTLSLEKTAARKEDADETE